MWRSNATQSGANTQDLGGRRRWGNGNEASPPRDDGPRYHSQSWRQQPAPPESAPPPMPAPSFHAAVAKEEAATNGSASPAQPGDEPATKKRRSRWGGEAAKTAIPGLPVAIQGVVGGQELENYATQIRLEEITRKLRMNDVVPDARDRSPSPPPQYDSHGRRTNTRELRYRKKLEDERHILIEKAMANDPAFRPPPEYQRQRGGRCQEKVYIPVKDYPEINFFGLLVGPRGNTLKKMERESGAKISIRGKGSVKEGKQRPDGFQDDENDEMHCLVMGDDDQRVKRCIALINNVIETAASTPESANDHKRNQLRELALLNGTLRDDEGQACQNCGQVGHRKYDCPNQRNFTASVICRNCGQAGHFARDCMQRRGGGMQGPPPPQQQAPAAFDSEFASLMAELGEKPTTVPTQSSGAPTTIEALIANAPWRNPDHWFSNGPQQYYGRGGGYDDGVSYGRGDARERY